MILRTAAALTSFMMIVFLSWPTTVAGQVVENWHKQVSGFWGVGVVTDANSNIYVTGASLQDAAHNYKEDVVLIKYSATETLFGSENSMKKRMPLLALTFLPEFSWILPAT